MFLTFAGVGESSVIETSQTILTILSFCVVQTFQTFAADAIAASHHADVNVAVALTGSAGASQSSSSCRVAIKPLLTNVTART